MYKPVIGLEIHAELKTRTKMFCDSLNDPDEKHPNINICPICVSHPGTLPVINQEAVKKVIIAGLALNCKIAEDTFFERKNYFYPDLPKGYQISQYQKPLCYDGFLELITNYQLPITQKRIRITRIHLEEDAGRLYHLPDKDYSLVDYNRAGVPLMELVTEPDFESGEEVKKFAEELQLMWRYLGVSDANMEKGQMRVEVNISLSEVGPSTSLGTSKLGTKVEIKNINSVKFAVDAVDYEIKRQTELLEAGEKVKQETRGWDEFKKQSFSQRSKEEAHDYRYFPEPDLPPLHFDKKYIEEVRLELLELPQQRRERFRRQYNLPDHDIEMFTINKPLGDYFEHVASELLSFDKLDHLKRPGPEHQDKLFKLASNYLVTELKRMCEEVSAEPSDTKITPEIFADLVIRVFHGEVSSSGAQTVLKEMFATGASPGQVIKEKNLEQVSNVEELNLAVAKVIADNSKAVEDYKKGKEASLKFLVGMAMRETKGKANPQVVEGMLKEVLK
ncbi:MAG: Asp-tRNA(Asn)/Glu-tRNA(Gln) amidotransferase subunit GatB [Candidatus Taylorbacteria bacterium]|nr:Asp-tRNA(Asn)/Glu-tRNA(Gln) amidotransferase subunit GatB [Candidatus Taylorbacteria bacterium]